MGTRLRSGGARCVHRAFHRSILRAEDLPPLTEWGRYFRERYAANRRKHPDGVLVFEAAAPGELACFFEDAVLVSRKLDIPLSRGSAREGIPACSIPDFLLHGYAWELSQAGIQVAILKPGRRLRRIDPRVFAELAKIPAARLELEKLSARPTRVNQPGRPRTTATRAIPNVWIN